MGYMSFAGRIPALQAARRAAETRAAQCRQRLLEFESGRGVDPQAGLRAAQARLVAAAARAEEAARRLAETTRDHAEREALRAVRHGAAPWGFGVDSVHVRSRLAPAAPSSQAVAVHAVGLTPEDLQQLWLDFAICGGRSGRWEFEAYLAGLWEMSPADRAVLDHVLWERDGTL